MVNTLIHTFYTVTWSQVCTSKKKIEQGEKWDYFSKFNFWIHVYYINKLAFSPYDLEGAHNKVACERENTADLGYLSLA